MDLTSMDFDLNQELNDYLSQSPFGAFWEVQGYKAEFLTLPIEYSPEKVAFGIKVQITEGHLSPKAGAPC